MTIAQRADLIDRLAGKLAEIHRHRAATDVAVPAATEASAHRRSVSVICSVGPRRHAPIGRLQIRLDGRNALQRDIMWRPTLRAV